MALTTVAPPARGVQLSEPTVGDVKVSFTLATIVCGRGAPAVTLPERLLNSVAVPWKTWFWAFAVALRTYQTGVPSVARKVETIP